MVTILEAAPLKVGVRMTGAPELIKELQTPQGNPFTTDAEKNFSFLLYEGEAVALDQNFTAGSLKQTLTEAGRKFAEVSVSVSAGKSESEPVLLENLQDQDGSAWTWTSGRKYTLVELPVDAGYGMHYVSVNNRTNRSYTFVYDPTLNQRLRAVNAQDSWNLLLHKTDSGKTKNLAGAWFALYSPAQADALSDDAYNALQEKPENRSITHGETTYYLTAVSETGVSGDVEWENLLQDRYLYQEIKAPAGYSIQSEEPTLVTWDPRTNGVTQTYEVINSTHYDLPETGGRGTRPWYMAGGLLMLTAGAAFLYGKRKKAAEKK